MAAVLALTGAAAVRVWDSVAPIGEAATAPAPVIVQADIPAGAVALTLTRRSQNELRE